MIYGTDPMYFIVPGIMGMLIAIVLLTIVMVWMGRILLRIDRNTKGTEIELRTQNSGKLLAVGNLARPDTDR